MDSDLIEAIYGVMVRYIATKDRQVVADHVVECISESCPDEEVIISLAGVDKYLRRAAAEHVDLDVDTDD